MSNTIIVIRDEDLDSDRTGNLILPHKIPKGNTFGYFKTGVDFEVFFHQNIEGQVHDLERIDVKYPNSSHILGSLEDEGKWARSKNQPVR